MIVVTEPPVWRTDPQRALVETAEAARAPDPDWDALLHVVVRAHATLALDLAERGAPGGMKHAVDAADAETTLLLLAQPAPMYRVSIRLGAGELVPASPRPHALATAGRWPGWPRSPTTSAAWRTTRSTAASRSCPRRSPGAPATTVCARASTASRRHSSAEPRDQDRPIARRC
jgi:hypothetical protein